MNCCCCVDSCADLLVRNIQRMWTVWQAGHTNWGIEMDIIDLARESGLTLILDGRIGRVEYHSVCGSISALSRFAESVCQRTATPDDCASGQARTSVN